MGVYLKTLLPETIPDTLLTWVPAISRSLYWLRYQISLRVRLFELTSPISLPGLLLSAPSILDWCSSSPSLSTPYHTPLSTMTSLSDRVAPSCHLQIPPQMAARSAATYLIAKYLS